MVTIDKEDLVNFIEAFMDQEREFCEYTVGVEEACAKILQKIDRMDATDVITKEQHNAELEETTMKLKEVNATLSMTNGKLKKMLSEMNGKVTYKNGIIYGLEYAIRHN